VDAIDNSEKEIVVAVYSINNQKIVAALKSAQKRGIKLRVLSDSLQAAGKSSKILELSDAQVDVRVHSVHKIMHNKFAVFDETVAVSGSFNWTGAASNQNSENCIFFDEDNILTAYKKQFENLWKLNTAEKSEVKLAKIRTRGETRMPSGE
jgi:phosphatidylserine/phosphatidylglycerophosphate/cardiolipin synthase-like enzyme